MEGMRERIREMKGEGRWGKGKGEVKNRGNKRNGRLKEDIGHWKLGKQGLFKINGL